MVSNQNINFTKVSIKIKKFDSNIELDYKHNVFMTEIIIKTQKKKKKNKVSLRVIILIFL